MNKNNFQSPPKWLLQFFRWFCHPDFVEDIEGDLCERFTRKIEEDGARSARFSFLFEVLRLFRPSLMKSFIPNNQLITIGMFKHNLLISYRGFLRNKTSFLINLIGLSTGLACFLMIYLWVNDEISIDSFHEKDSQLYQVLTNYEREQGIDTGTGTPAYLGKTFKEDYPEVEYATPVSGIFGEGLLKTGEEEVKGNPIFVSEDYFQVFSYPLLHGDKNNVLNDKKGIIISESLARKLFNTTANAYGKTIEWEHDLFSGSFRVAGILEENPDESTAQYDLIFPHEVFMEHTVSWETGEWYTAAGATYLILQKGTNIEEFNAKIADFLKPKSHWTANNTLFVQQFSQRYLQGQYENGKVAGGRIVYVRLFSIIALFILLIACINFMNLSTAQASKKMKEIGIKKTIGAGREALIFQFLSESILMVAIAIIFAIGLVNLFLPQFNEITGKDLLLAFDFKVVLGILGIAAITGLLSGSYPAFYLSRFKPIEVLKGKLNASKGEALLRKGLVVFQFALSVIFIVGVLVINQQMNYTQSKDLGYNRDNIMTFQIGREVESTQVFISELAKVPGVKKASYMRGSILNNRDAQNGYNWRGDKNDEKYVFKAPQIGYDFIETLGMEIVDGRSFSREYNDDRFNIIINETALKMMDIDDPIGHLLDKNVGNGREPRKIIGVVKDFQYGSIHHAVEPLILRFRGDGLDIVLKMNSGTEKETIDQIGELFAEHHTETNFSFTFLDEDYQQLYEAEERVATLSKFFSALAIIISCLGLLGIATFTAERRTKEIGIRKILGSSMWGIVNLLSLDFTKMVLLGILVALPFSYLVAQKWLDGFAYRIDLEWWYFLSAGLIAFLIAFLTVGLQTLKTARINPVECLRDE